MLIGTRQIPFGRKKNEVSKFTILDEKTKCTALNETTTKIRNLHEILDEIDDFGPTKNEILVDILLVSLNMHAGCTIQN